MKKIRIIGMGAMVAIAIALGVTSGAVYAEENKHSMTVSPQYDRVLLVPGRTYTKAITISNANSSTDNLKYSVLVGSFSETSDESEKDDYGTVDHISKSNYNQIMDWIRLEKEEGEVAPNKSDTVRYTIEVPENAPAGGQYATIIVRDMTGHGGGSGDSNVSIQSIYQFGSIIYAEVAGETKETGEVVDNSVPFLSFGSPLTVSSMVKNDGNVHTDAKYTLQVWPLFSGEEIYSNEEEPMTSLILPESERMNTLSWEEAPMVGIFKVRQTVEIFGDISTVEKIVIICPLWLLSVIILAIALGIYRLITRGKNKR